MQSETRTDEQFLEWLHTNCHYINCTQLPGTQIWVAFEKLIFHWSLVGGPMHDDINVNYRYCYTDLPKLAHYFVEWQNTGYKGEPDGWHKKKGLSIDVDNPPKQFHGDIDELMDILFEGLK